MKLWLAYLALFAVLLGAAKWVIDNAAKHVELRAAPGLGNTANHYSIWVDPQTQCQYVVGTSQGGITPRLGVDGFPLCASSIDVDEPPACVDQGTGFPKNCWSGKQ